MREDKPNINMQMEPDQLYQHVVTIILILSFVNYN